MHDFDRDHASLVQQTATRLALMQTLGVTPDELGAMPVSTYEQWANYIQALNNAFQPIAQALVNIWQGIVAHVKRFFASLSLLRQNKHVRRHIKPFLTRKQTRRSRHTMKRAMAMIVYQHERG